MGIKCAPQIGHGWVLHARPERPGSAVRNSFRYPAFNLLVPVDDHQFIERLSRGLLVQVRAQDYLEGQKGPLGHLIRDFLKTHCDYTPEKILLQTLPRMLGYVFNPVSFWFCFKQDRLDAVLCEVNNTFGDRHFYFLSGTPASLAKKFHVSPFLPIAGNYEFHFNLSPQRSDVRILLRENGHLLLTTRLSLNLRDFSRREHYGLWLRYGWFSVAVILRIHWQALRLWCKKAVFHQRPHPPVEKVSR